MKLRNNINFYGTFGPSTSSVDDLKQLFQAGMTGIRLNLSHTNLCECEEWLSNLHEAGESLGIVPELLVDLQGPELRIGTLDSPLVLEENTRISLEKLKLPSILSDKLVQADSAHNNILKLDDGKIVINVVDPVRKEGLIIRGGTLTSKKSVYLENYHPLLPALTKMDLQNIKDFRKYRVTGVMLPFVRKAADLIELKKALLESGQEYVRIFAKIETMEGVRALPELLPHCDEVVIARGDLGNDSTLPLLPSVQKEIASICRHARMPFMVVTQLLASMEHNSYPTRAEVNDIFNAILDGASSLMLTGETAVGKYPKESMEVLCETAWNGLHYRMEPHLL